MVSSSSTSSSFSRPASGSPPDMPPRRKPDFPAAKTSSPPRPQISDPRRAAEWGTAFPRLAPSGATAPEENADDRAHTTENVTTPRDSTRGHPRCSGERSAATGRILGTEGGRDGTCSEAPEGSKSKSSAPLSPDALARHDALVAAKALMQFPPSDGDPRIYQAWRARVEALLDYADGGPRPDPTRAPLPATLRLPGVPRAHRGLVPMASAVLRPHPPHRRVRRL